MATTATTAFSCVSNYLSYLLIPNQENYDPENEFHVGYKRTLEFTFADYHFIKNTIIGEDFDSSSLNQNIKVLFELMASVT